MKNEQTPIHSGFGFKTRAEEVVAGIELNGQVALVTGGASGIGFETARVLAAAGATVVVAARDEDRARLAIQGLERTEVAQLDLAAPASIDRFCREFLSSGRPLDILVNNAGIMFTPLSRDQRGYESQFATNHLGHFQLTVQLWSALKKANGARIVNLSSRGHRFSSVHLDDPNFERRPYDKFTGYGQSKTANALFTIGVDNKGRDDGIRAFAVHPGRILATNLSRFMSGEEIAAVPTADADGKPFNDPADYVKSVEEGAATSVWCSTSPQLNGKGGLYSEDCDIASVVPDDSDGLGVRRYAIDPEYAERLWRLSEELCGVELKG